ncbi:MAG: L-serine ammonia-lyase, partial [Pseudomonadota bacterium]
TYYSIGGGFILSQEELEATDDTLATTNAPIPHPFNSANELMALCETQGKSIDALIMENECANQKESEVLAGIDAITHAMDACIDRGMKQTGILPGGLNIKRRAHSIHEYLKSNRYSNTDNALITLDWINLFALSVNEENAAGGRVVTAPTNGAAGVIPAVLRYYKVFVPNADQEGARKFLLTAAAIAALYHKNASISAAEVGCQGEVGVACSMAAAGLCAVMDGTIGQIENAAEIGMEHNLGLTCDPVGGLVQVPCIERNTMGAIKAVNAARLALLGDGKHYVSLDNVIQTMWETGKDMQSKYKETSTGGLASNMVAC